MSFTASITDNNVDQFIALLEQAESDKDRSWCRKLLVAEVGRYAQFDLAEHRSSALDSRLALCKDKIERQRKIVEDLRSARRDATRAQILLGNLKVIHDTLAMARSKRT
ncbi:MAG TPA: hypothetical protein VMU22_13430 [Rhizomicrobium sp.]|nr:hypothetical protein [Rhizomicrobium sp.]